MQEKKEKQIRVAMFAPGWPLSACPNGIVTYVNNISRGFNDSVKLIILTNLFEGAEIKDKLIDLSAFSSKKKILDKLFDKFLNRFIFLCAKSIQYKSNVNINVQRINLALRQLSNTADILEIEESFGIPSFLQRINKVPIVTRLHGPWFTMGEIMHANKNWDYQLRVFYEGEAIKHSHGITAPSLDVLESVRKYYDIALPYAQVIPNPVPQVDVLKQWKLSQLKRKYILFVGRFDLHKGGDLMLDAFRLIALKNDTIELLFVGPDRKVIIDGENFSFSEYLERFIPEVAIKNRIEFLGHCDQERISDLRKNALITVVCSRYETFSISLVESLAVGCPTVATAAGGMKEIVIHDYNGFLAEPESPESIAEKVLILISDPEKMQRLSKNAIEDCKKRFSPEIVASQTLEYYESVLARVANSALKN